MVTKLQWLCWKVHDNWVTYSRFWSRRSLHRFCGKSSNIQKPIRCVQFTKAVVRHADIRDQKPSLGVICPGDPHQRNLNAPKIEDRSQEETEWQERCAREAAWRLAKSVLKLKEKNKQTFFSPSENRCLPASNLKTWGTRICCRLRSVDAYDQQKDLKSSEMDTLTKSCSPTIVITANGEVQTHEEATVYVKELDILLTMKVLEDTPAVLSLGKLCDEHGYSCEWINGQKPHLIQNGVRIQYNTENFVPIVVPGLSSSSSSSSHSSTSMTPSRHERNPTTPSSYFTNHNYVKRQWDSRKGRSEWDRFPSSTCVKFTCWRDRTERPVVFQHPRVAAIIQRNFSWMTEFLNAETHTPVLLMNHL